MNREEFRKQALAFDKKDSLAKFRDLFVSDDHVIYLDGNSLGKLPKATISHLQHVVKEEWGNRLIRSWNEKWIDLSKKNASKIAKIVGAKEDEIFVGDSTSLNLYKLSYAALKYNKSRNEILTDQLNFPTDLYILQGLIKEHFQNHKLLFIESKDQITTTKEEIISKISENTSLLTLSHVTYKSSFLYPMKEINEIAHKKGSLVLWDLSHAVGAVPIKLNDWNADLAVGCTYKYLNGGPGAPAFLYVNKKLQEKMENPVWSWFGHDRPFDFSNDFLPSKSIQKFGVGTPTILSLSAMEKGLEIMVDAGVSQLREKSKSLTEFMMSMIETWLIPLGFSVASPKNAENRGSHISIQHENAYAINCAMIEPSKDHKSIIPDFRPPNNIRLGIAPLYISFLDLYESVIRIAEIVENKEYLKFKNDKNLVP
ncbi:kynureninase [Namhaeicola litoreus]|uniref:Kynureninase n=1 Tax=Namhaeicola litoreus TaxID=1052145 RepID=A0ABW3Y582_9FLAO